MNEKYRLWLILFFCLGCLFYSVSGADFLFSSDKALTFEMFSSVEERLNDDLPILRQAVSGKTLNTSAGMGNTESAVPDPRVSFSKIDRGFETCAVKHSSLIFVPLRC